MKRKQIARVVLQVTLPLLVLATAAAGTVAVVMNRPEPPRAEREPAVPPLVHVLETHEIAEARLTVQSQGTVQARRHTALTPRVGGTVEYVAPSLIDGGTFREDELLLRIEAADYQQALAQAQQTLAQARLALAQERIEAGIAAEEWQRLGRDGDAPDMVARKPHVEAREAAVAAAEQAVARAERDLARTELRAPYDGRVVSQQVDEREVVGAGKPVAQLVSIASAEVRLPIYIEDLPYLALPFADDDSAVRGVALDTSLASHEQPRVTLRLAVGSQTHTWQGRIVRTGAKLDPQTRTLVAIAEGRDPDLAVCASTGRNLAEATPVHVGLRDGVAYTRSAAPATLPGGYVTFELDHVLVLRKFLHGVEKPLTEVWLPDWVLMPIVQLLQGLLVEALERYPVSFRNLRWHPPGDTSATTPRRHKATPAQPVRHLEEPTYQSGILAENTLLTHGFQHGQRPSRPRPCR